MKPGLCLAVLLIAGCASPPPAAPPFLAAEKAIPGKILSPGDSEEALNRFKRYFSDVTRDTVLNETGRLYARDAFFNDTLKTIRGSQAIQAYFLKLAGASAFTRVQVRDVARSGKNYFVLWEMEVRLKGSKTTIHTIGMSLLRFDSSGRIVLHQDFWDSSAGLFEHFPAVGPAIRAIKSAL